MTADSRQYTGIPERVHNRKGIKANTMIEEKRIGRKHLIKLTCDTPNVTVWYIGRTRLDKTYKRPIDTGTPDRLGKS